MHLQTQGSSISCLLLNPSKKKPKCIDTHVKTERFEADIMTPAWVVSTTACEAFSTQEVLSLQKGFATQLFFFCRFFFLIFTLYWKNETLHLFWKSQIKTDQSVKLNQNLLCQVVSSLIYLSELCNCLVNVEQNWTGRGRSQGECLNFVQHFCIKKKHLWTFWVFGITSGFCFFGSDLIMKKNSRLLGGASHLILGPC